MAVGLYSGVSGLALGVGLYKNVSGLWGGASGLINGFGGSGPFPGSVLYLNFSAGETLDPRITFSRGSNATLVDATGKIVYAPANLLAWSEDFTNAAWVVNGSPVITANQVIAPDGTMTADTMAVSGASNGFGVYRNVVSSGTYVSSMYFKLMSGAFSLRVGLTSNFSVINCSTLAITNTGTGVGSVSAVGNGWYRFVSVGTISALSASEFYNIGSNTGTLAIWGAQLEPVTYQTTPSTYVATTASAYYGPRFDYDPVTLAPKGLLIEEARTNLALYSQDFTNAAWTKNNSTVTANVTNAPNGTTTAFKVAEDATTAFHGISQLATLVLGTANTQTFFVKAAERNWVALTEGNNVTATAYFNLATGTVGTVSGTGSPSASIVPFGNGWYRISLTFTPIANSGNIQIRTATADGVSTYAGTAGSGIYAWGAQLEAGSFATSYIPTVASTVTRSADVATMTGTNFSSWFNPVEGTFVTSADAIATGANRVIVGAPTLVFPNYIRSTNQGGAFDTANVAATANVITTAVFKLATTYGSSTLQACLDGGTAASTSYNNIFASLTAVGLGSNAAGGAFLNGHIRQIAYYNTRLPNAQLQTLTAPSLATTLSLSFTNQAYTVGV
jgi:hypothetical protein